MQLANHSKEGPVALVPQSTARGPWGVGKIVAGRRDEPLRFDPNKLGAREAKSELIQDLKELYNLEGYAGDFVSFKTL
jgi:hypothetical protein